MKNRMVSFLGHLSVSAMCFATCTASAGIYKCPDTGGKTKFQDTPCVDGKLIAAKPAMGEDGARPSVSPTQSSGYPKSSATDPMVGMGKNSLIQALGMPSSSTDTTDQAGANIESLTFLQHGKAIVAYLRNGFVFKTSSIERDWIRQPGSPVNNCPSAIDIRNAETSANSITLTEDERRDRQYKIMKMKACLQN